MLFFWWITWVRRLLHACSHASLGHGPLVTQRGRGSMGILMGRSNVAGCKVVLICKLWKYSGGLFSLLDGKLKPADERLVFWTLTNLLKVGYGCHRSAGQKLKALALKNPPDILGELLMAQKRASCSLRTRWQLLDKWQEFHGVIWP